MVLCSKACLKEMQAEARGDIQMEDDFTLEEVIEMATNYASEQFSEVLNDYKKQDEFFKKYEYTITVKETNEQTK